MADLTGIVQEINEIQLINPIDKVRAEKIRKLSELTGRNTICYYSGFLENPRNPDIEINDKDMNGFMTTVHGLDKDKGLDLLLHSPGGLVSATESIGDYLKSVFCNDIRVFVPQLAMSGGTMLSCIGKEIYMGKHSSIGPVDPQFSGISAYNVIHQFEEAKEEIIKNPASIPYWQPILGNYPPDFIKRCEMATALSGEVLRKWLKDGLMFDSSKNKSAKIRRIVNYLNNNEHTKMHDRHINAIEAQKIGLKIILLEDNAILQDAILSVHHAFMLTFQNTNAVKIIENQNDKDFIITDSSNKNNRI